MVDMRQIFLFTDYRNQFYSSTKYRGAAVDTQRLSEQFANLGFELVVQPLAKIDFRNHDYKDQWILYQSSEDPDLKYRSYIDDLILGLHLQGARLIPSLGYFRAHHNKNFLEILRDLHPLQEIKNISSACYGTYEDYAQDFSLYAEGKYVLKASATSKSKGVALLRTSKEKTYLPKKISGSPSFQNLRYYLEWFRSGKNPLMISNHRNKFVVQNYVDGLDGDYRVVVYGNKFYVLYRANREKDFRASGSMKFNYDIEVPQGLLDFSKKVFESFDVPYMALDIGMKGHDFYLFEFQFLSFGQYTLEKSRFNYQLFDGTWQKVIETPDLEREIANSAASYIKRQDTKLCVE